MQGLWAKTAANGFRMTKGDPFRPLRPASAEQGWALGPTHPPPAGTSLRAGVVRWSFCGAQGDLGIVLLSRGVTTYRRTLPREWHSQAAAR